MDNEIGFESKEKLIAALKESDVICGEQGLDCPNNVAKLVYWVKDGSDYALGVCSGTLVKNNYILTNSHCIPENLTTGSSCDSQILIQFPETATSTREDLKCLSVVKKFNHMDSSLPDLAVLKVESSRINNFDSIRIAKNNFIANQNVHAYTMNPGGRALDLVGTIVRKECNIIFDNFLIYNNDSTSKDYLISGNNCNIISGNSGSGLFNDRGELIGAIHQKIIIESLERTFSNNRLSHDEFNYIGVVANIGCLDSLTSPRDLACDRSGSKLTIDQ